VLEQVELDGLIAEAIALGCADPQRHGIEVVTSVPAERVTLDRHRVLQVLVNLITNARDSLGAHERTGAAGPFRIAVTATLAGGALEIAVADTGGGIAPEALRKVFSAGFTTKPRGHGYGLHSSALTAEQLGGALTCASAGLGAGARFVLRVPVKEVTSHAS
jgi:signal transduction histidine kinase